MSKIVSQNVNKLSRILRLFIFLRHFFFCNIQNLLGHSVVYQFTLMSNERSLAIDPTIKSS